jgi:hypothetical protein
MENVTRRKPTFSTAGTAGDHFSVVGNRGNGGALVPAPPNPAA